MMWQRREAIPSEKMKKETEIQWLLLNEMSEEMKRRSRSLEENDEEKPQ